MDRWQNKVAVVTGASSGIGAAIVKDLVKAGIITVGLARREERVKLLRNDLPDELKGLLHAYKCDVSNEESILNAFAWIEKQFSGVDILVNNAAILRPTELIRPNNTKDIKDILDTNVLGVVMCTREAFNSMKNRNVDGHIVLINSIVGHHVPNFGTQFPSLNIYPSSKYAITAMTETLRQEVWNAGTKVKITSVSPGAVDTEMIPEDIEEKLRLSMPLLKAEDVSDAVLYVLGTPPHVQIHELTIKPIGETF